MSGHTSERMQCMEVWGGNEPADRRVAMAGLDAAVFSAPVGESNAGGDIHYLSSCATGRITRILVADVSGHGESVADVARSLRDLMRRFINFVDPTRMIDGLNRAFASLDTAGLFATAVVATYWAPTRTLTISNAGHPRPLWYRAKHGSWSVLASEGASGDPDDSGVFDIPLGIDADGRYSQFGVRLSQGDVVLFYTDALTEASSSDGRMLGEAGFLDLVRGIPNAEPMEFVKQVVEAVAAHRGGRPSIDDTTVLALTPNQEAPVAGIWTGLLGAARIVRASVKTLLQGSTAMPVPQGSVGVIGGAVVDGLNRSVGGGGRRRG